LVKSDIVATKKTFLTFPLMGNIANFPLIVKSIEIISQWLDLESDDMERNRRNIGQHHRFLGNLHRNRQLCLQELDLLTDSQFPRWMGYRF
jgi:hypothetical protein